MNYNRGSGSSGGGEAAPSVPGTYRPLDGACPLTARKFPPFTALRLRQLFVSSCPAGGAELAASKAAQVFSVEKDPDVVLLRGRACSPDVQRQVLAHNAAGAGRRLLCAARRWAGGAAAWLPESDCEV